VQARLAEGVARWVTRHPRAVLASLGAMGLAATAALPGLTADFAPEDLVPASAEDRRTQGRLDRALGATGDPVMVLITPRDGREGATSVEVLGYLRRLGDRVANRPGVARVVDLTRIPLPAGTTANGPAGEADGGSLTLDDLEGGSAEADEGGPAASPGPGEEAARSAMVAELVATDPERFPRGLPDVLGPDGAVPGTRFAPLVTGDAVDEGEARAVREALAAFPELNGRLIGRGDGVLPLIVTASPGAAGEVLAGVREAVAAIPPPDAVAEVSIAGLPSLQAELVETMSRDQARLIAWSVAANLLVLLLAVRWWPGVLLPLGAVGLTLGLVVGGMAAVGEPLNLLNNVVPPLLITLGLGDAVHLVERVRGEPAWRGSCGDAGTAAVERATAAVLVACLWTSVTTAAGFASLLVSRTEVLRRFGVTAALGVMVAFLVTATFVPAALAWLGPGRRGIPPPPRPSRLAGPLGALARRLAAPGRHRVALGLGVLVLAAGLAAAPGVPRDRGLLDLFPAGARAERTTRKVEAELQGIRRVEVGLEASGDGLRRAEVLDGLDRVLRNVRADPLVLGVSSPSDPLHRAWSVFVDDPDARDEPFGSDARVAALVELVASSPVGSSDEARIGDDGTVARAVIHVRDAGADALSGLVEDLRRRLEGALEPHGVAVSVTGEATRASLGLRLVVADLTLGLGLALVVVFGVLALAFRSLRLALASVLPNVLPLAVAAGWMAWRGIPLNASTTIVFAVSLGLAVDGTIHLVTRYRQERAADPDAATEDVVAAALAGTGTAIVVASATLVAGFGALLTSVFVPIRVFGELSVVAILVALVAELGLMPALLAAYDRVRRAGRSPSSRARSTIQGTRSGSPASR